MTNAIYIKPLNTNEYQTIIGSIIIYKLPNKSYTITSVPIFVDKTTGDHVNASLDNDFIKNIDNIEVRSREITKGSPIPNSQCEQKITFNAWVLTTV
jgi:hypothetical protein